MKAKSNKLYQFLKDNDLIGKSKEEIKEAKLKHRKEYLRVWHKEKREQTKDIRIRFSPLEFSEIKQKANLLNLSPTMYSKLAILQENQSEIKIPNKAVLQELVQKLGILGMTVLRKCPLEIYEEIEKIENILIEYISEK